MALLPPSSPDPPGVGPGRPTRRDTVWQWLTAPSARVVQPDQRRQAQLLATMLVIVVPLVLLAEAATVFTFLEQDKPYSGYIVSLGALAGLSVAYVLSRTAHFQRGALLTTIIASVTVFVYGASVPGAAPDGFLNWLLIPLLLASAFLPLWQVVLFSLANLAALIVFPFLFPAVSLGEIVLGPLTFFMVVGGIVLVLTRHRDKLESDRLARIRRAEVRARHEAERTTHGRGSRAGAGSPGRARLSV